MPILCYHIARNIKPNDLSTTGAEEGHLSVLIKSDRPECNGQVYSELVANSLAMFLGLPVALGVPARHAVESNDLRFASLMAFEDGHEIYDFTCSDDRCLDLPEHAPESDFPKDSKNISVIFQKNMVEKVRILFLTHLDTLIFQTLSINLSASRAPILNPIVHFLPNFGLI